MILKSISGKVLYECEAEDIGYCLRKASIHGVNLEGVDLRNLNLSGIAISRLKMEYSDLTGANFSGAYLTQANLYGSTLKNANFTGATVSDADLDKTNSIDANFTKAVLYDTTFDYATLKGVNFTGAILSYAGFRLANLQGAQMEGAILNDTHFSEAINIPDQVIEMTSITSEGKLTAWKKCKNDVIVQLTIPENAKRSNATGRKCRAEFAEIVEIFNSNDGIGYSLFSPTVAYKKGETIHCHEWNEDRWQECSGGIHFFLTREEAENYLF